MRVRVRVRVRIGVRVKCMVRFYYPYSLNAKFNCSIPSSSVFCCPHVIVPRHMSLTRRLLFPSFVLPISKLFIAIIRLALWCDGIAWNAVIQGNANKMAATEIIMVDSIQTRVGDLQSGLGEQMRHLPVQMVVKSEYKEKGKKKFVCPKLPKSDFARIEVE